LNGIGNIFVGRFDLIVQQGSIAKPIVFKEIGIRLNRGESPSLFRESDRSSF